MSFPFRRKATRIAVLTLSTALMLSACDGVEERKAKYFNQAEESFVAEDYDKAKLGYKNVIQIDPKDIDARLGLAKVMVAEQNWRGAAGQYQGVLEVDPQHTGAAIELGKLYLLARAQDLALAEAEKVLAVEPDNLDAMTLKGGVLAQRGDLIPARSILEKVQAAKPGHVDNAILLANVLVASQEHESALKAIDQALAEHPDSIDLHAVKVGIYQNLQQPEKAIETLERVIALKPENFVHKQRLVAYLGSIGRVDEAENTLRQYIEAEPENIEARKSLVDLLVGQQKLEEASALLGTYSKKFEDEPDFQLGLARIHLMQQKPDEALRVWDGIIANDPQAPAALKALNEKARFYLSNNEAELAKPLLEQVITANAADRNALLMRGNIAQAEGRHEDAIADFRVVMKNDPDDPQVMRALANTHFEAGELRLAENYFKQLVTRFPQDMAVRHQLAVVYAQLGKTNEALALREEIQQRVPANAANQIELAKLYMSAGQVPQLEQVAVKMVEAEATKASGLYFRGLAAQMQQAHEQALSFFDQSLALQPNAVEPISAKVKLLIQLERKDEAKQWLQTRLDTQSDNALLHNLYAETLMLDAQHETARAHLDRAIALSPEWTIPYRNKALGFKTQGQLEQAITVLKEGVAQAQSANGLRLELAQLLEATSDVDGAIEQYDILNSGDNPPAFAANNLAMLLVTYKEDEASLEKAARVAEVLRGTTNPRYLDTLGWVYFKRNQVDLALPLIREAAERAPEIAQINYHLALAYHAKNNAESAVTYLEKALASEQGFVGKAQAQQLLNELKTSQAG